MKVIYSHPESYVLIPVTLPLLRTLYPPALEPVNDFKVSFQVFPAVAKTARMTVSKALRFKCRNFTPTNMSSAVFIETTVPLRYNPPQVGLVNVFSRIPQCGSYFVVT